MITTDPLHGTMKLEPSDEVLKEIYRLRAENEKLRAENEDLQGELKFERHNTSELFRVVIEPRGKEIEKLRAALKPFADAADDFIAEKHDMTRAIVSLGDLRAAAAALKETGE